MDSIFIVITLVQSVLDKYDSIQSLHEEIKYFRKILRTVKGVLNDIQEQLQRNPNQQTRLSRPLSMLEDAVKEGAEVLEECSRKKKLRARVFSKTYLGKLNGASTKMRDAMQLLSSAGISIQGTIAEGIEDTVEKIDLLKSQIENHNHQVADLMEAHAASMTASMESLPQQIVSLLMQQNVVSSFADLDGQMEDIASHAQELRREKAFVDKQILAMVERISLMESNESSMTPQPTAQHTHKEQSVPSFMICPISLEIMKDPVLLTASGMTYDRASLCASLLAQPNLCPCTNNRYDNKLGYTENISLRQAIMHMFGDNAYQRYDDTGFALQYDAAWDKMQTDKLAVVANTTIGSDDLYREMQALFDKGWNDDSMKKCERLSPILSQDPVVVSFLSRAYDKEYQRNDALNKKYVARSERNRAIWCHSMALSYREKARIADKEAIALGLVQVAQTGNRFAQFNLGVMYKIGWAVAYDRGKAVEWYTKAANQGNAYAQNKLGYIYNVGYKWGWKVSKDCTKAVEWYTKAANQGHAEAQYHLGNMYYLGWGVAQDKGEARKWYFKAANQGYKDAEDSLAAMHRDTKSTHQSLTGANQSHAAPQRFRFFGRRKR